MREALLLAAPAAQCRMPPSLKLQSQVDLIAETLIGCISDGVLIAVITFSYVILAHG